MPPATTLSHSPRAGTRADERGATRTFLTDHARALGCLAPAAPRRRAG